MTNTLNGATTAAFVVALSQPLTEPVQVKWATKDGTGKAGTDYDAVSGSLTFAPGETSKQIQVTVYGRDPGQGAGDKSFYIVVEPPINAILDDTLVECTIVVMDEEGTPVTSVIVAQGRRGPKGEPGLSAYEQAVLMGYQGSIQDWMDDVADASQAAVRANTAADRAEAAAEIIESATIPDQRVSTWSGRTQQNKNKDSYSMQDFNNDLSDGLSKANKIDINSGFGVDTQLVSQTEIRLGFGRTILNNSMGRSIKNAIMRFTSNLTRLSQTRISSGSTSEFAIKQKSLDTTAAYYNTIDSVNIHDGSSGIEVAGVELFASNVRITNPSTARADYGVYQKDGLDTTICNLYIENCETGIESWRSWTSFDTHVVYAQTAFNMQSSNNFGSSAKLFAAFADSPKKTGFKINRSRGTYFGVDIWNLGKYTEYSTQIGIDFGIYGSNNAFFGLYINNQDSSFDSNVTTYMQFDAAAVNNLFAHIQGKYKLRSQDISALRNQTVIGCTDEWARHNNVVRKCRGSVFGVSNNGGTATLKIKLDYNYSFAALNNTLLLLRGNWVCRTTDNQGAYGTIHIPFGFGISTNLPAVITTIGGSNTINWQVTSKTLVGDELTLNLTHNSTNGSNGSFNGTFALEVERSLDSGLYSV